MPTTIRALAILVFLAAPCAAADDESKSALERDPNGWTDLLAQAGPKLEGWVRSPLPARGKLNATSQWSLDSATGNLVCQGDGGHEWLRWDKELCRLHLPRRVAIHGRAGQERLQFRDLCPQFGRCHDLASGPDR